MEEQIRSYCKGINCPFYTYRCIAYQEPSVDCPLIKKLVTSDKQYAALVPTWLQKFEKETGYMDKTEILLSPEEIIKLDDKLSEDEYWLGEQDATKSLVYEQGIFAKAQAKKFVEYLDTLEFYNDWGGESGKALRDSIKQAILEEVKDE